MVSLTDILAVAAGGATGAVARYLCQTALPFLAGQGAATLAVNVTGSLVIGVVFVLLRHHGAAPIWSLLAVTGFLGGFTTFSTFSLDTIRFIEQGQMLRALCYAGCMLMLSILACGTAVCITQRLLK